MRVSNLKVNRVRAILIVILGLAAVDAVAADWKLVEGTDETDQFIDTSSIRVNGSIRRVWEMWNRKSPEKDGTLSYRILTEYDCRESRYRLLDIAWFSLPNVAGERAGSD